MFSVEGLLAEIAIDKSVERRASSTSRTSPWVGKFAEYAWRVSDVDLDDFASLSHDKNPIHLDDAAARALGFTGRVVHGALLIARVSYLLGMRLPGPTSVLLELRMAWPNPTYVGDALRIRAKVVSHSALSDTVRLRIDVHRLPESKRPAEQVARGDALCLVRS